MPPKNLLTASKLVILGSGTFGLVFGCQIKERECVLKISSTPNSRLILHERDILHTIGNNEHVTSLVASVNVHGKVGHEEISRPGLVLHPKGMPLTEYVRQLNSSDRNHVVAGVSNHISSALAHVHSCSVYHNDVSPKNIIVHGTNQKLVAKLVDFGISSKKGESLKGVHGTVLFVHKNILAEYPNKVWEPCVEYDFTSLGYSLLYLMHRAWNMKGIPCSKSEVLREKVAERALKATQIIFSLISQFEDKRRLLEQWLSWIRKVVLKRQVKRGTRAHAKRKYRS